VDFYKTGCEVGLHVNMLLNTYALQVRCTLAEKLLKNKRVAIF